MSSSNLTLSLLDGQALVQVVYVRVDAPDDVLRKAFRPLVDCAQRGTITKPARIALDMEWKPVLEKNAGLHSHPIAVMQFYIPEYAVVLHIPQELHECVNHREDGCAGCDFALPAVVNDLLMSHRVRFITKNPRWDMAKLFHDYALVPHEVMDVEDLMNYARMPLNMATALQIVFPGSDFSHFKDKDVTLSDWSRSHLTTTQIMYAAFDGWATYVLWQHILHYLYTQNYSASLSSRRRVKIDHYGNCNINQCLLDLILWQKVLPLKHYYCGSFCYKCRESVSGWPQEIHKHLGCRQRPFHLAIGKILRSNDDNNNCGGDDKDDILDFRSNMLMKGFPPPLVAASSYPAKKITPVASFFVNTHPLVHR